MEPVEGRLVGYTDDLSHLVFSTLHANEDDNTNVMVPLTDDLIEVAKELLEARETQEENTEVVLLSAKKTIAGKPAITRAVGLREESKLRPGEIQKRLRAGEKPADLAKEAETSIGHILRWYEPIKAEQKQIISIVQHAVQERFGQGYSTVPILQAVHTNLSERGIPISDSTVTWTAAKYAGRNYWTVTVRYEMTAGHGSRLARWKCVPHQNIIEPLDEHAREIGFVGASGGSSQGQRAHSTMVVKAQETQPPVVVNEQRYAMGLHPSYAPQTYATDSKNVVASRRPAVISKEIRPVATKLSLVRSDDSASPSEVIIPIPTDAVQAALQADPDSADPIIPASQRYPAVVSEHGQTGPVRSGNISLRAFGSMPKYVPYQNYTPAQPPSPRRPIVIPPSD